MKAVKAFLLSTVSPLLFTVFLLFSACHHRIDILTYNVQNLFDDVDDGTEYSDFDPGLGIDEHVSQGGTDVYLCKFLQDGYW